MDFNNQEKKIKKNNNKNDNKIKGHISTFTSKTNC